MDAVTPKCPSCHAPVQPDWDFCQACGYDPDDLRPPGWISPALYQLEADGGGGAATATKTKTKTKGRKARRREKGIEAHTPPPPLIELPDNLAPAHDPISDGRSSVRATAAPTNTPSSTGAPPAPAPPAPLSASSSSSSSSASPSSSSVSSAGTSDRRPPPAPVAAAPAVAAIGEPRVYRVAATPPEVIGAGVLLVAAAGLAYLTVRGILQVATGASTSTLDNVATVVFVLVCAVIAFAAAAQGLALVRQRVELHADELVAHNRFGRVQRVPIAEIYAIRLSQRQFQTPRGLSQAIETPYLQRGDGTGFWLDALGGRSPGAGPSDQQLALFEQLHAAVDRAKPPRPSLGEPGSTLGI